MKKYIITVHYKSYAEIVVEAKDKTDAVKKAYADANDPKYDKEIIHHTTVDNDSENGIETEETND
jgi:hypothetical protein